MKICYFQEQTCTISVLARTPIFEFTTLEFIAPFLLQITKKARKNSNVGNSTFTCQFYTRIEERNASGTIQDFLREKSSKSIIIPGRLFGSLENLDLDMKLAEAAKAVFHSLKKTQ